MRLTAKSNKFIYRAVWSMGAKGAARQMDNGAVRQGSEAIYFIFRIVWVLSVDAFEDAITGCRKIGIESTSSLHVSQGSSNGDEIPNLRRR